MGTIFTSGFACEQNTPILASSSHNFGVFSRNTTKTECESTIANHALYHSWIYTQKS